MPGINIADVSEQIGLPELSDMSDQEITDDFIPACVIGLSDGDLGMLHGRYEEEQKAHLYGSNLYNDGEVAKRVLDTALQNGTSRTPVYYLQDFIAECYDQPGSPWRKIQPTSVIKIYPEAITIDGNPIALQRPPGVVLDYAACLSSRSLTRDQIGFIKMGEQPFVYSPLTRLHFINRVLAQTYDSLLGTGGTGTALKKRLYIGREDGIASATDHIIESQSAAGVEVEVADIVLCTAAQHATPQEVRRGIENAYPLMRPAGMLVIRGFGRPSSDEVGTDEIASWAFEAGFEEHTTIKFYARSHNLGNMVLMNDPAHGYREMKTVILSK